MKLREYQKTALEHIKSSLEKGYKAPLLVLPTGAGKTVIFSELAKEFVNSGKKVLILVHRRELLQQACNKLDLINVKYGIISAGFKRARLKDDHKLQVASVYTLYRNLHNELFEPDIIIFDEAHHVAAGTWVKIVKRYNQSLKIGVTATPIRLDNKPLGKYFDHLIQGVQVQELVKKNFLCKHKVFAGNIQPNLSKLKFKRGDYKKQDLKEIMDQPFITGDAVEQYKKHLLGKPAIAFCVDIEHAKKVNAQFLSQGVRSEILTGEMSISERDIVLNKLRNHDISVIVSIDIISEGTDLPCVTGAILLRPTNSEALYMQQVGRILRPEKNKLAIVLDHVGNTYRHDFIDVEKNWVLEEEDETIKPKGKPIFITCKKCNFIFKPQKICPNCGHETSKKQLISVEGQLKEIKRELEKDPRTIKDNYKFCIYSKSKYNKNNIEIFKSLYTKNNVVFEPKTSTVQLGDNIIFYRGHNQQTYGIVIGFIDNGYGDDIDYSYVIPPLSEWAIKNNYRYAFSDLVQVGMRIDDIENLDMKKFIDKNKLPEKKDDFTYEDVINSLTKYKYDFYFTYGDRPYGSDKSFDNFSLVYWGKRSQPYVYLIDGQIKEQDNIEKYKFYRSSAFIERLYLKRGHKKIGIKHNGYDYILLTDDGIEIHSNLYSKINFKQGIKVKEQMRSFKNNKFLLSNFIEICRKAHFNVGYNADWAYRNYYARKLIKELQTIYK